MGVLLNMHRLVWVLPHVQIERGGDGRRERGETKERTAAAGLYETELREKTRFCSASPVLRRWAAAVLAPLT